jgi:hypothetical protein
MMRTFAELDYAPLDDGGVPAMVTLTLPGDWEVVAPTAKRFKRHFLTWRKRYERAWGSEWVGLWKLEFQGRGAPHLHLYMSIPRGTRVMSSGAVDFRTWCRLTWADVVGHPDAEQRRRHRLAGTRVDVMAGMKASDPKRLAVYFGKHSSPGQMGPKEYQHVVPVEWGDSPGRFWGYIGLEKHCATVQVDAVDFIRARRILRRWSRTQTSYPLLGPAHSHPRVTEIRVRRGREGKWRTTTRRRQLCDQGQLVGGFTMSNDGPAMASKLARALDVWRE